jgi:methylglutaconyl-CoA hydratase
MILGSNDMDSRPSFAIEDGAATIKLNRPGQHNRMDPTDIPVLRAYIAEVSSNPSIRALVLTGTGPKTFSSGYTLSAVGSQFDQSFEMMLNELERCPVPTICALNGSVYGGATDMVLCCDIRIGTRGSRMFMPAAKIGLHYYPDGVRRYVRELGVAQAKRLFLTAMPIDAEEMLRINFLTELVSQEELLSRTTAYADALRECEPSVIRSMKYQIGLLEPTSALEARSREYFEASLHSMTLRERINKLNKN